MITILPDYAPSAQTELSLQYFKGVGPARAKLLEMYGIKTLQDVLHTWPRAWEDRRRRFSIREAPFQESIVLEGTVQQVHFRLIRSNLGLLSAILSDGSSAITISWFKTLSPRYDVFDSLRKQITEGISLMVYGSLEWMGKERQLSVDDYAVLNKERTLKTEDTIHFGRIVPRYTLPLRISEKVFRHLVFQSLNHPSSENTLKMKWIQQYHFPETFLQKEQARQALAREEFLLLELALGLVRRSSQQVQKPHRYELKRHLLTPFRQQLPFVITDAQKRVIREIFEDLQKPAPMNRLLQGDVGSGKTLVAFCAMLLAVENGGQAALMVPTEILAEQHLVTFKKWADALSLTTVLLKGKQTSRERKEALTLISEGKADLIIGTHALLENPVAIPHLRLIVIDEQHRFGVNHRSLLRNKGNHPDILIMTATPIPRTLALTHYGDLDISTIDQLPTGRKPIQTSIVDEASAWTAIEREVQKGRQAYIIYPLVDLSDKIALKAATQEGELLRQTVFKSYRVAIVHGQLKSPEKESIMTSFHKGEIDILVATTVIEVGIDVPNATIIAIQHAERFGLSALHQLRGRVGRGAENSYCLLIAEAKGADAQKRLRLLTQTQDGFLISEEDLKLRGPGEVIGVRQHGIIEFKLGDLVQDALLIQECREKARIILEKDPHLLEPQHKTVRKEVYATYAKQWALGLTA